MHWSIWFYAASVPCIFCALPLRDRLLKLKTFEDELAKFDADVVHSVVGIDYAVDAEALAKEAEALRLKFGETLEYGQLGYFRDGSTFGKWTTLSLKAANGDMCNDMKSKGNFSSTLAWDAAPAIRSFLAPIEFALQRVRVSTMHPFAMVAWHCDDCPGEESERCTEFHVNTHVEKHTFHKFVRLHVMLTSSDVATTIGGLHSGQTFRGGFHLANVAMPHRVDNQGSSTRLVLLVDVQVNDPKTRKRLRKSPLGQSILKAVQALKVADAKDTYLKMFRALYRYRCALTDTERFETEWHKHAWSNTIWRPLPPFQPDMFNSPGRCGILGPPDDQHSGSSGFRNHDRVHKASSHQEVSVHDSRIMRRERADHEETKHSALHAHSEKLEELERWYGRDATENKHHTEFKKLLLWFHSLASKHNIKYALAFGTSLGFKRHPHLCFIPGDHDVDVFVQGDAAKTLKALAANKSETNIMFVGKTARKGGVKTQSSEPQLLLHPEFNKPQDGEHRKRWNCHDEEVSHRVDKCSFRGPLASLVLGDVHMGISVWYRAKATADSQPPLGSRSCGESQGWRYCEFVPANKGTALHAETCMCGDIETKCLPPAINEMTLTAYYGRDYMTVHSGMHGHMSDK
eukprot:TRINITY_DN1327_c0_g3_i1.p1 TRINITY_DN1327_c0_g3~~TRINITY_DN1327_c0_g3_i1.p1  ORF type:complete len:630 (-),score=46.19 TRINITY_DN1327_c0_g3_i1:30-1919(-)